jgi:hypothetical protein
MIEPGESVVAFPHRLEREAMRRELEKTIVETRRQDDCPKKEPALEKTTASCLVRLCLWSCA